MQTSPTTVREILQEMKTLWLWLIEHDVEMALLGTKIVKVCDVLRELVNERATADSLQRRKLEDWLLSIAGNNDLAILDHPIASSDGKLSR